VVQAEARLEAARANAAEVAERYSAGLATVLERADAAVEQFEAEAELVRQRYARALSRLALGRALGAWPTADVPPTAAGENPP
jgi:outer membrane protein TolC